MSASPSSRPFAIPPAPVPRERDSARALRRTSERALTIAEPYRPSTPPVALPRVQAAAFRTTFERFELKYWVTETVAERLIEFSAPYLELDPWSRKGLKTRNVSLYLDTRGLLCLENHVSGALDRWKLRVRAYGEPPTGSAFFEVKRKAKGVTLKKRATLPVNAVRNVLTSRPTPPPLRPDERRYLDDFIYLQRLHRMEPQVLVAAYRDAFVSKLRGEDVRMTIDREMVYQRARGPELNPNPRAWTSIPGIDEGRNWYGKRRALVELKFRGAPPAWMREAVMRLDLKQSAFSKYVSAMLHMRDR
jgi:hypothetical protein